MRLTLYSDYALRTLIQVGLNDGKLTKISDIAQSFAISKPLDEGRQPSQSKGLSRHSARP
jgi:DNA-binding IscR family transcriptional regulator